MRAKGRHKKVRYIQTMPRITQFSPRGKAGRPDEIELRIDHLEAIKIADYQGYSQTEGAMAMGISRPSFGRILREGRKIIANALTNGKAIRIRTGSAQVGVRHKNLPPKLSAPHSRPQLRQSEQGEEAIRRQIIQYKS